MPPVTRIDRTPHNLAAPNDPAELNALMNQDIHAPRRGALAERFRALISPYLITDVTSDQFLYIHRAAAPLRAPSSMPQTISAAEFQDFLISEAPELKDSYLSFKSRGHTGCVIVAHEATTRLNRRVIGCAETRVSRDGIHNYTQVSIEGRDYWLDATIDQFVAYPEILECHRLYGSMRYISPELSYAGLLLMPHQGE